MSDKLKKKVLTCTRPWVSQCASLLTKDVSFLGDCVFIYSLKHVWGRKQHRVTHAHLWVDEWALVEELWDLEEAWLAGNDPSVAGGMTRSGTGTFFGMYYVSSQREREREKKIEWIHQMEKKKWKTTSFRPFVVHLLEYTSITSQYFQKLTSKGISSGPGPGWLGPLGRLLLGCSGHMFCRRWLCIFFLCFLLSEQWSLSLPYYCA